MILPFPKYLELMFILNPFNNMRLLLFITSFILLLTTMGCNSKNSGMLQQTDSLLKVVQTLEIELNSIRQDSIAHISDTITFDVQMLETIIGRDTLTLKEATTIDNYTRIKRSLFKLVKSLEGQKRDLNLAKKQLGDMRHDITEDIMTETAYQAFMPSEIAAIGQLAEANTSMLQWYKGSITSFSQLRPLIISQISVRQAKK